MYNQFTFAELWRRLFGNFSKYGLGVLLMKFGALLVLPLYWEKLSPEQFGVIGLAQVMAAVVTPLMSLGLQDSIQRFYFEWKKEERPAHLGTIWLFSTTASLILCLLLNILGERIFSKFFVNVSFDPYLRISLWTLFFTNFSAFSIALFRIREDLLKYNLVSIGTFLTQTTLLLVLLYGFDMGLMGYFLGLLLSSILWSVLHIIYFLKSSKMRFNLSYLREPFRFSFFIMLVGLFDGSAFVFDRFFLDKQMNLAAIGIYAVAMQIAGSFNVFNLIFKTAWLPFLYRVVSEREDSPKIVGLFSIYSLAILAVPGLAIAMLAEDIFRVLGNSDYSAVGVYVPLFVLGNYFQSVGTAMGRGLDLSKSNEASPLVPIISLFLSFALSSVLVPAYGLWGAATSFVLVMLVRSLVQIYLANRVYPRPFYWKKILALVAIVSVSWWIGTLISTPSLLLGILLKVLILKLTAVALLRVTFGEEIFYGFLKSLRLIKTESPTARE